MFVKILIFIALVFMILFSCFLISGAMDDLEETREAQIILGICGILGTIALGIIFIVKGVLL